MIEQSWALTENQAKMASYVVIVAFFAMILGLDMNGIFVAGLIGYTVSIWLMDQEKKIKWRWFKGFWFYASSAIVVMFVLRALFLSIMMAYLRFFGDFHNVVDMGADIVQNIGDDLPTIIKDYWPNDSVEIINQTKMFLKKHAGEIVSKSKEALENVTYLVIGTIIGSMIAFQERETSMQDMKPFTREVAERLFLVFKAFKDLLRAQAKISAINVILTAVFVLWLVPTFFDKSVPFGKSLVVVTFFVGLIPIVGNLISNMLIAAFCVSISFWAATASLIYLVVIHKVEYFLNAKIASDQVGLKAYQILIALVVGKIAFGMGAVFTALVLAIYIKEELRRNGLV